MKYFLIAGETSGDQHAASLMQAIQKNDLNAEFAFWGGDAMAAVSPGLKKHYKTYSIMGFVEVLLNIRNIFDQMRACKKDIVAFKPDVLILVDFPGFNLRMAAFAKSLQIKVAYYIAPKVWAWNEKRVKKLEQFTDLLLLILPFEETYFKPFNVNAVYVGNPSAEQVSNFQNQHPVKANNHKPVIALLPGSRAQEVQKMAPLMAELAQLYPQYQFVFAGAPALSNEVYKPYLHANVSIVYNQTYELLHNSTAAIVCSGTATLETALFGVPQVCGYKANSLSYLIAKNLVRTKYISLVNLCMNKPVIRELIQHDWNLNTLKHEFEKILSQEGRTQMRNDYHTLREVLQSKQASETAANAILQLANANVEPANL
jgi:lipid-A-disaccharide synthase